MFWGITLESGKKYTQVLQKSFCVTMAALGFENPSNDHVYVVAEVNNAHHVLCCLQSGKIPQQTLNLNFTEGELVSFFIEGEGEVHLTGYLVQENNDSDLSDDSSDEENEKEEVNGTDEVENTSRTHQSNHIHTNGIGEAKGMSTETVSEVSWQGMLSASQDKDVSDGEMDVGNQSIHEIQLEESSVYNGGISATSPKNNAEMSPVKSASHENENGEEHSNVSHTVEPTDDNLNNSANISHEITHHVSSTTNIAKVEANDNSYNVASCGNSTTSDNLTNTESSGQSDFTLSGENDEEMETDHSESNTRRTVKRTSKQMLPTTEDEKQTKTRHSKRIKSDKPEKNAPTSKAEKKPSTRSEKKTSTKSEKKPGTKTEKKPSIKTEKKLSSTKDDKKAPASKSDKKVKSMKSDKKSVVSK